MTQDWKKDLNPIVQDFNTYLHYLETHKIKLTKSKLFLSRKDVYAINKLMTAPEDEGTGRLNQEHFLRVHLFYYLSLVGELAVGYFKDGKVPTYELKPKQIAYFRSLNPLEQYFYLFKTLFEYCDFQRIPPGEGNIRLFPQAWDDLFMYLAQKSSGSWLKSPRNEFVFSSVEATILSYFSFFGFWKIKKSPQYETRTGFMVEAINLSPLGAKLIDRIAEKVLPTQWNTYMSFMPKDDPFLNALKNVTEGPKPAEKKKEPTKEGAFEDQFRDLFPNERLGEIQVKEPKVYKEGCYRFKIWPAYHANVWRTIQVTDQHTLEELHGLIQDVFNFDDDHLYTFFPDGHIYSPIAYEDPRGMMGGKTADEITIGELYLKKGQRMAYLFDYGDQWIFGIDLEEIIEQKIGKKLAFMIESHGEAPEQYPEWEEE